ncbi:unnamed protein product [Ixodes hexagonus]
MITGRPKQGASASKHASPSTCPRLAEGPQCPLAFTTLTGKKGSI